ncbi:Na/Pi cotransporter family protein [Oscillibacter sp. GMB15532]|uniref:Na/Pi cotransporter family protein n=1 Tax=Oscillibacter sp. GMB15532 TaxID=3230022 RepID=UPI0034DEEC73
MESLWMMLGGVVLFLFGITLLGEYLREFEGGRAERLLRRATDGRGRGFLLGFLVTAVVQSSSAVTVMTVSLADAGILTLGQIIPVMIGSNLGTTATAWLLCFRTETSGAPGLTVILACIGLLIYLVVPRRRVWGGLLLALFLLLVGMERMAVAAAPIAETEAFRRLTEMAVNPLTTLLAGTIFTGVIQSSSASIGLLQAFSTAGSVTWGMGVPLVLGGNIGTCVTVLLASVGCGANAKRAAFAHLKFNVLGTAALLPLWLLFGGPMQDRIINPVGIAVVHTAFNLLSAVFLLPVFDGLTGFFTLPTKRRRRLSPSLPASIGKRTAGTAFKEKKPARK